MTKIISIQYGQQVFLELRLRLLCFGLFWQRVFIYLFICIVGGIQLTRFTYLSTSLGQKKIDYAFHLMDSITIHFLRLLSSFDFIGSSSSSSLDGVFVCGS